MPRSSPPRSRFDQRQKALLTAASRARGERAREQLRTLIVEFTKALDADLPYIGGAR